MDAVSTDLNLLLKTLRGVLKARKYTYARVARGLGVSEITVKRWLSGRGCTLDRLFAVCELAGISFFDLAALAGREDEVDYVLSPAQEAFFARKPALFGLLKELCSGRSPEELETSWKLGAGRLYRMLRELEKQGLLEVGPRNQLRGLPKGNIRSAHRGPLAKKVMRPQISRFLDHVDEVLEDDDVAMHSAEVELSNAHIAELIDELHALGARYRARAHRDRSLLPPENRKSVRWLLVFAPFKTDWSRLESL